MNISNKRKKAYKNQNTEFFNYSVYVGKDGNNYMYLNRKMQLITNDNSYFELLNPKPRDFQRLYSTVENDH